MYHLPYEALWNTYSERVLYTSFRPGSMRNQLPTDEDQLASELPASYLSSSLSLEENGPQVPYQVKSNYTEIRFRFESIIINPRMNARPQTQEPTYFLLRSRDGNPTQLLHAPIWFVSIMHLSCHLRVPSLPICKMPRCTKCKYSFPPCMWPKAGTWDCQPRILEFHAPVQIKAPENLLARLERFSGAYKRKFRDRWLNYTQRQHS